MLRLVRFTTFAAALIVAGAVQAGSVADFETMLRGAYGDYRGALFQTNAGNQEKATQAIDSFRQNWAELADAYTEPPPHYVDDANYQATIDSVATIVNQASEEAAAGDLTDSHETLEAIRDEIGELHRRNGVISFSDRMNAYHAKMEEVLAKGQADFGPEELGMLREDGAILAYLAADLAANPPPEASDPAYQPLLDGVTASVAALLDAARNNDPEAARKAVNQLKMPYAKLFLKFG